MFTVNMFKRNMFPETCFQFLLLTIVVNFKTRTTPGSVIKSRRFRPNSRVRTHPSTEFVPITLGANRLGRTFDKLGANSKKVRTL